jgi:hypothetical protein
VPEDAGLVALDIVDALIATGRNVEARALTEQVIREFAEANLGNQALTALAYLQDLLRSSPNPRKAVSHVRSYMKRLKSEPSLLFLHLDEKTQGE